MLGMGTIVQMGGQWGALDAHWRPRDQSWWGPKYASQGGMASGWGPSAGAFATHEPVSELAGWVWTGQNSDPGAAPAPPCAGAGRALGSHLGPLSRMPSRTLPGTPSEPFRTSYCSLLSRSLERPLLLTFVPLLAALFKEPCV